MKTGTVGAAFKVRDVLDKSARSENRERAQPGTAQVYRAGQEALR
ncbi:MULTISPECIES: hypothetical protein [unclassified Caballeronia]|nr:MULTISPECIES: hypothetical protein [unclassified Caballeronia]MDR5754592.1 hypothetical protein [Caballeronia sp. LZ024]MDR5839564.1 hypothetical protein [Caballeronia sp. LZ031]